MPVKLHKEIRRNQIDFPYAIRSFIGYLEGTKKSAHTIKNYRLDLNSFQSFLTSENSGKLAKLEEVTRSDLERYRHFLKEKGLKINTRRRKILTVTQFLNYLAKRKKLSPEFAQKVPAPHKVERIPFTVSAQDLVSAIHNLQEETVLDLRNKVLLWSLAETGCLVSEVTELRYEQWALTPHGAFLRLGGKSSRSIPVTAELLQAVLTLKKTAKDSPWIFQGFNKFGSLGAPITPRGVELLVKHYGPILGFPELTPRTFRHSVILKWFQDGMPQNEIQTRLGLKTTYAFRSYEPLLKSKKATTSNSETPQTES
jgi:site-specific recombinase XerD